MKQSSSTTPVPQELCAWLDELPAGERAALEEAWQAAEGGRPAPAPPDAGRKAAVWAALEAAMDAPAAPAAEPLRPPSQLRATVRPAYMRLMQATTVRWMAAAAVVLLLVAVGLGYWIRPITIAAPNGSTLVAVLPDGSSVELNSGSAIQYPRHFVGGERRIRLQGEAFFDVEKSPRPFIVETFNARTTVLGTSFNVRARGDDVTPATSVVVATGRVQIASKRAPEAAVVLSPGQSSILTALATSPTQPDSVVSLDRALAWRSGGFSFSNQPLGVIFGEIERRFNVRITAGDAVRMRSSGFYLHEPQSAEEVIATLTQATGFRYRETVDGFEVYVP